LLKLCKNLNGVHLNEELRALEDNGTWELTTLPTGKSAIGWKWFYKTKLKSDGAIERYKATLVVRGFSQEYGLDYEETFAPAAKMTTVRAVLAVAAIKQWQAYQMNVSNAFLHGDLEEVVYIKPPAGYTGPACTIVAQIGSSLKGNVKSPRVCKLLKSLYGLRQAPLQWFAKLSSALLSYGFQQSKVDYNLFRKTIGDTYKAILVYVDDMIITGNEETEIVAVKSSLHSQFHMKDLGVLRYFLGLEVARSVKGIFICQRKYALELIHEVGLDNAKPLQVPMDTNVKLTDLV